MIIWGCVGVAVWCVLASAAFAADPTGDYIAFRAIGGYASIDDITENAPGPMNKDSDDDLVGGLGIALGYDWRPFVGLGVGWARNISDVQRTPVNRTNDGPSEDREDTNDNVAWSAGFGVVYRVSDRWRLELAYRYIDLGTVEMGPYSNGTVIEAEDYVSHDLMLGLQVRF